MGRHGLVVWGGVHGPGWGEVGGWCEVTWQTFGDNV